MLWNWWHVKIDGSLHLFLFIIIIIISQHTPKETNNKTSKNHYKQMSVDLLHYKWDMKGVNGKGKNVGM
jgi:hypothetical protein